MLMFLRENAPYELPMPLVGAVSGSVSVILVSAILAQQVGVQGVIEFLLRENALSVALVVVTIVFGAGHRYTMTNERLKAGRTPTATL